MGVACSTNEGEVHTGCWWESLKEREHFEDLVVDGFIMLKCIFKKYDEGREVD